MIELVKVFWELLGNQLFGSIYIMALFIILMLFLLLSNYNVEPINILTILLPIFFVFAVYVGWLVPVVLLVVAFSVGFLMWKILGQQY